LSQPGTQQSMTQQGGMMEMAQDAQGGGAPNIRTIQRQYDMPNAAQPLQHDMLYSPGQNISFVQPAANMSLAQRLAMEEAEAERDYQFSQQGQVPQQQQQALAVADAAAQRVQAAMQQTMTNHSMQYHPDDAPDAYPYQH